MTWCVRISAGMFSVVARRFTCSATPRPSGSNSVRWSITRSAVRFEWRRMLACPTAQRIPYGAQANCWRRVGRRSVNRNTLTTAAVVSPSSRTISVDLNFPNGEILRLKGAHLTSAQPYARRARDGKQIYHQHGSYTPSPRLPSVSLIVLGQGELRLFRFPLFPKKSLDKCENGPSISSIGGKSPIIGE